MYVFQSIGREESVRNQNKANSKIIPRSRYIILASLLNVHEGKFIHLFELDFNKLKSFFFIQPVHYHQMRHSILIQNIIRARGMFITINVEVIGHRIFF